MADQHPITPPPELIEEWIELSRPRKDRSPNPNVVVTYAARWGADTALDACCDYLTRCAAWEPEDVREMLNFVRPPSLKEQALALLDIVEQSDDAASSWDFSRIRRALESLPN